MAKEQISLFKSNAGKKKYFSCYNECMSNWPVEYTKQRVSTKWGNTIVYSTGIDNAEPIVLLHGMAVSIPSWYPNIASLSKKYKIYAFGYPGDLGFSDFDNPPADVIQAAEWFCEVCDKLNIKCTNIIGTSFGAFLSTNITIKKPERIKKVILISPAGVFVPITTEFYIRVLSSTFFSYEFIRKMTVKWFYAPKANVHNYVSKLFELTLHYGKPQLRFPPSTFSDEELKSIKQSVLLLLGRYENVCKPVKTKKRANNLIKDITVKIIPDAGHFLPIEQSDIVNKEINDFLKIRN